MEVQLQELIEQIKKEGVAVAETEASAIVADANTEAERIIAEAKAEAERVVAKAKEENARFVQAGEDAVKQAGRNLLISFRESVVREFDAIVGDEVKRIYAPETLSPLLIKVVEAWAVNAEEDISVLLNGKDLELLEDSLLGALKEKLNQGVTLKPNEQFDGGFRISVQDGKAFYDFSAESVTEMLSAYLNPKVTALMKEAGRV